MSVQSQKANLTLLGNGRVTGGLNRRVDMRQFSWKAKPGVRPAEPEDLSESEEELAKAAILDKVMKGRQPTELLLRCKLSLF